MINQGVRGTDQLMERFVRKDIVGTPLLIPVVGPGTAKTFLKHIPQNRVYSMRIVRATKLPHNVLYTLQVFSVQLTERLVHGILHACFV